MFKRRDPQPLPHRIKEVVWPRKGLGRPPKYIAHRLRRLPGTPYRIAAGFASGAAVSFTPFIGLHFVLAAVLCLSLRGNIYASAIGTAVGNPWTFPLIWAWLYSSGHWLLGHDVGAVPTADLTFTYVFDNFWAVMWPMTVSGIPTSIVAWFAFFLPIRSTVEEYQKARRWRIRRKVMKRREQVKANKPPPGDMGPGGPGDMEDAI